MIRDVFDTNIILRYVLEDQPEAKKIKQLLTEKTFFVPAVVIAESVWVLAKAYNVPRERIAHILSLFINQESIEADKPVLLSALSIFSHTTLDYPDCYLAALTALNSQTLYSFDNDFKKVPGVRVVNPKQS